MEETWHSFLPPILKLKQKCSYTAKISRIMNKNLIIKQFSKWFNPSEAAGLCSTSAPLLESSWKVQFVVRFHISWNSITYIFNCSSIISFHNFPCRNQTRWLLKLTLIVWNDLKTFAHNFVKMFSWILIVEQVHISFQFEFSL